MDYETVIGLEVHAQLRTKSKMFCRCNTDYANASPNSCVCPVCLGMPGALPVINRKAVEYTIVTALALNCTVAEQSKFDRKNYSYPDLMKGYQISQYDAPIGACGCLIISVNGGKRKIGITRVHLEEDVAKLLHRATGGEAFSLVDVNRSGVPLMEIVSEPDLRSPEEARQYLIELRSILRYLEVSTANMEEGSFRCDANISIRPKGSSQLSAKVEVKNMNSFRSVYRALEYEVKRQIKATEAGKRLPQETRGWLEDRGVTVSQRSKEYAHDYRYFPEPDLPPLTLNREWVEEIRAKLPELPEARRERLSAEYGLSPYDAELLTGSREMADYFESCLKTKAYRQLPEAKGAKEISNWLLGEVSAIINADNIDISGFKKRVNPEQLVGLLVLRTQGAVNTSVAKSVLGEMYSKARSAAEIIKEKDLSQISDSGAVAEAVVGVIKDNAKAVADYNAGKETALKFLVGQVMRLTRGRANPQVVNELLKERLKGE